MIPDVIVFSPEEQYLNNLDVDAPTLYRRLASSTQLPTTAHPNLEQCMQAFQTVGEGDEVLCLSPTSKMSGAYNTACSARELLKDQGFTTPITVYDSLQVSFGLAVLAREAGRMAKAGLSAAQIVDRLDQLRPKVGVYFVMESLENARRGGRVGAIRVLAADLLKVKPILTFRDGLVRDIGIVCGYANAVERVISLYQSKAQYGGEVFLFHADREELAQQVILLAVFTLGLAGYVVYKNCRTGKVPMRQFTPMFFGVGVMFVGTVSAALPQMVSIPVDTFSCTINAICLYYMLYQRRVVQLRGFTNNAPIYVVSLVVSILLFLNVYDEIHGLYLRYFGDYRPYETIVMAAMLTVTTLVLHRLFYRLMENLLLKGTELQEQNLREFSTAVNKILQLDELLALYCDFLQQNFPGQTARVFLLNRKTGSYCMKGATDMSIANRDSFAGDHPMITWLKEHMQAISYENFSKTKSFRAMWRNEKKRLEEMNVNVILPVISNNELVAVTLISLNDASAKKGKGISVGNMTFLESTAAVLSIALNNAALCEELKRKAHKDPLTNLYNRGYFLENIAKEFALSKHDQITLMIINLDDFRLYNELYGTAEGDRILKRFGEALKYLVNNRGTVARYGGKEFVISFPFCPPATALECAKSAKEWLTKEIMSADGKTKKFLTFSAGISSYPSNAASVDELFTYANMAVYSAKNDGKNKIVLYTRESENQRMARNVKTKRALAESCASTIYALTAAIDAKDHYTFSHSNHVAQYASVLAEALGLDAEHIEIIRQAGLLHDIGKIGTPEAILSKTTRLTQEEYEIMKQHVEASISMIKYLPSLDYVIPSVLGHHERWDGGGYPRGLSGNAIPIGARCLCLADSFDAMISKRSYKEAMSVEEAIGEIRRNQGTQFDPELAVLFIQLIESGKIQIHNDGY